MNAFGWLNAAALFGAAAVSATAQSQAESARFRLITLDPGHFHSSLVQKVPYPDVDSTVHVYAPAGDDVAEHLKRIELFNTRPNQPTHWTEKVYTGPDFLDRMVAEKAGNVVVIAGNNARKTEYIVRSIEAGFNVLGDKPMVRTPEDFVRLQEAFKNAEKKHVLLYDIMTERHEITTVLQRELSMIPAVFGDWAKGTVDEPAITIESVHFFSKIVAGVPLKRPQWFYDVRQEGEGLVDVMTHLVDLVQWEAFPEKTLAPADAHVERARRWVTPITLDQFKLTTGAADFPDYLKNDLKDSVLQVYANGEFTYRLRGVFAKVTALWKFEAPPGSGDTHYSVIRGTKAVLTIRQGAEEHFKPVLYVEKADPAALEAAIASLQRNYPGIGLRRDGERWAITIPEKYDLGHESHFGQVTEAFLRALREGHLPAWEVPGMLTKYSTIMEAYTLSHKDGAQRK